MAQTVTTLKASTDYGRRIGYEMQQIVWAAGTTTGTIAPTSASSIFEIDDIIVLPQTTANPFKCVLNTSNFQSAVITGNANETFVVTIKGRVS